MPGLKTVIPVSFTDTSLPVLRDDPILPNAGALVLVDMGHSAGGLGVAAGQLPAANALVPNIVAAQAVATVGSGTAADMRPFFYRIGYTDPALGKLERTARGGLHSITSKATDPGSSAAGFDLPTAIKQFIWDNTGLTSADVRHKFYSSAWVRITRNGIATANALALINEIAGYTGPSSNFIMFNGQNAAPDGATLTPGGADPAPQFTRVVSRGYWAGTRPSGIGNANWKHGQLGASDMYSYTADIRRGQPDIIVYRAYLEDLTVSGRTAAEVESLDRAAMATAFALGGRFYGDTFTDPTTIL